MILECENSQLMFLTEPSATIKFANFSSKCLQTSEVQCIQKQQISTPLKVTSSGAFIKFQLVTMPFFRSIDHTTLTVQPETN